VSNLAVGTSGGGHAVEQVVIGKGYLNPSTDTLEDVEAAIALLQGAGGVQTNWARQVPAPGSAGIIISSYPTDADPYFRYTIAGKDGTGRFTQSINVVILRRLTGTGVTDSGVTGGIYYWGSEDGPQSWYDVQVTVQNTADDDLPTGFKDIGDASAVVDSGVVGYQDPRNEV